MNLNCINIDQHSRKIYLTILLIFLIHGCTQVPSTEYKMMRASIPDSIQLDKGKHIALIFYNPEGCLPCNNILSNMLHDSSYLSLIGGNSFVVFPSIRESELQEYDDMFKMYGNVHVKYINDKKLFELLKQKDKEKLGGKPKWVGLNITRKGCTCLNLKEMYLIDSIIGHFK